MVKGLGWDCCTGSGLRLDVLGSLGDGAIALRLNRSWRCLWLGREDGLGLRRRLRCWLRGLGRSERWLRLLCRAGFFPPPKSLDMALGLGCRTICLPFTSTMFLFISLGNDGSGGAGVGAMVVVLGGWAGVRGDHRDGWLGLA